MEFWAVGAHVPYSAMQLYIYYHMVYGNIYTIHTYMYVLYIYYQNIL